MKMAILLLTLTCLQVGAKGFSQGISITAKNTSLEKIFKEIEKQSPFRFIYSKEAIDQAHPVTIEVKNEIIENVLKICFSNQPISYAIEEKFIIVKIAEEKKPTALLFLDVKGRIVNEDGAPVAGATITVKATGKMTISNANGGFVLNGINPDDVLVITAAEMQTVEVKVGGEEWVTVAIASKVKELDQTIVIGYGTTTRRYSTGSVSKVTAEEIGKQPVSNPLACLQGRVPGLVVTSTSGIPGASFTVQIRGQNTMNPYPGNLNPLDQPLFIIDGVPFAPQNSKLNQFASIAAPDGARYNNSYGGISPFNSINPADIESMEVLRDADATSIYGSRGANGVIIITTKKGKAGKTKLSLNFYTGGSQVTRTMPLMNTDQYRAMRYEAFRNDGLVPGTAPGSSYAPDLLIFDSTRDVDWKKYFLGGTARTTDMNLSLSGGSENNYFLFGSGYHHESDIFPGDYGSKRASFNFHFNHLSTDRRLFIELASNYSYGQNNSSGNANVLLAYTLPPNFPGLLNPDGSLNWNYKNVPLSNNPLGYLNQKYLFQNHNLVSNLQIGYRVLPDLSIKTSFGYNSFNSRENSQLPKASQNPANNPNSFSNFGSTDLETWVIEPQVEYNRMIANGRLNVLLGVTFQQNNNSSTVINASNYTNDVLLGSVSAAGNKSVGDAFSQYKYEAFFGRVNYIWNQKYIVNLTGRRDGSSRFGPGRKFGNFGSAGAGWIFSQETFMKKNLRWLSYGKLKGSYGTTGSDGIGDYGYIPRWGTTSNYLGLTFQGANGYVPLNLFNSEFSWSVNKKFETGLELGILKNRVFFSANWFRNQCSNQLVTYQLPSQTGFPDGVTANFPAMVENKGWEFSLNWTNIKSKNFSWNTQFNFTTAKNKLVSFPGFETSNYTHTYVLGQPLSVLMKFKFTGVNPMTGIYEFATKNGTVSGNPDAFTDYFVIGDLDPRFYGGCSNSFSFRSFQADIFLEFKKQSGPNYLQQIYSNFPAGTIYGNLPVTFLDRWQKAGDVSGLAKLTTRRTATLAGISTQRYASSDAVYSDASYIRFKTISLSYKPGEHLLKKIKMSECKVFVNAQNLFTITRYKGNDPETMSFYSLPPLKTIVAGIQFTF